MMIWYSSMTTATQSQQSWNDDVSILRNIISENERRITKSESKEAEDEFSLDIDEQLTWAMLQRDELRKKQKLAASSYSIRDWDSASRWNNEEKSSSLHSSSHEEFERSTHRLHSVDDDETKSSRDRLVEAKTLNVFEEVLWQNLKKT